VRIQGILGDVPGLKFVYFHPEDVVRHRLVRDIIRAFESYHARQNGKVEDGVGTSLDPAAAEAPAGEARAGGATAGGPEGASAERTLPEAPEDGNPGRGPAF